MKQILVCVLFLLPAGNAFAGELLISEIAPATTGGDWIELFFRGACGERIDISRLYVTMYYGTNEPLSTDPVSLYGCDRPETPWDDRYAVVHPAAPGIPDETDLTGDTNGNGVLDIYCNNYPGSLWNSDCVVAIDSDDEPSNGGIIDFAAFSNRDGSANDTMLAHLAHAQSLGHWETYSGENPQLCMIDIGIGGLQAHQSIARRDGPDTGRKEDFAVTSFQTPGRPNIFSAGPGGGGSLFVLARNRITVLPGHPLLGECHIALTVREVCSLRFRVFTPTGVMVHESPLLRDTPPGPANLSWDLRGRGRSAGTGLYILLVEATSRALRHSQRETAYLIVSRYR